MNIDNPFVRAIGAVVLTGLAYYLGSTEAAIAAFAGTLYGEYARPTSAFRDIGRMVQQNWRRALPLAKALGILALAAAALWGLRKLWQNVSPTKLSLPDWHWPSGSLSSLSAPSMPDWLLPLLAGLAALAALIYWLRKRRPAPAAQLAAAPRRQFNWRPLTALLTLLALIALLLTQCSGNGKKPAALAPKPAASAPAPAPKPVVAPTPAKWTPKVYVATAVKGDGGIRMIAKLYDKKYSLDDALALAKQKGWTKKVRGKWVIAPMVQPHDVWTATERQADGGYDLTVRHATRHKY